VILGLTGKYNQSSYRNRVVLICAIVVVALLCSSRLSAQTVATYNFEDATADGWSSFNGATTPIASNAAAYAGSYSLLTTSGSGGSGGPSISLNTVLQAGAKYTITGYVMLTGGETATNANFTIRRSDPSCSGGTCYDTIGSY
jgi:endo-1,4-beta-xylanase